MTEEGLDLVFATNKNPYGSESYGGAEASCRLLAEQLAGRGHRSTYLTHRVLPEHVAAATARGVTLHALPSRSSDGGWRPARHWRTVLAMAGVFARHRFDVAYCFYEPRIMRGLLAARRVSPRTRIVMQMAGQHWYESCLGNRRNMARYERLFRKVDCVNFVDDRLPGLTRERLDELGMEVTFARSFTGEIGSGAFAHHVDRTPTPPPPFRIVMAARFADYSRRQDLLIEAMSRFPPDAGVELILAGDGKRRTECERMVVARGLGDRVVFRPFLAQSELWDLMSRCHLLVHCAEHEGLGKIIIEAMALGLPVLASDVPVINGYIEDNANGFLAANDPDLWARRLVELRDAPDLLRVVAQRAGRFARERHSPETNVLLYEGAFRRLVRDAR